MNPEFTSLVKMGQHYSWQVASLFARLGEEDTALDWLEHAVDRGYVDDSHVSAHGPFLARLRRLARFRRVMDHMNRRWELAGSACSRTGD